MRRQLRGELEAFRLLGDEAQEDGVLRERRRDSQYLDALGSEWTEAPIAFQRAGEVGYNLSYSID